MIKVLIVIMILLLILDIVLVWFSLKCGGLQKWIFPKEVASNATNATDAKNTTNVTLSASLLPDKWCDITVGLPPNTYIAKLGNVPQIHRLEVGGIVFYANGSEITTGNIKKTTTTNGTLKIDLYETVEFGCKPGYVYRTGALVRKCLEGNTLSGSAPQCLQGQMGDECKSWSDCLHVEHGKTCDDCCIPEEACALTRSTECTSRCQKGCGGDGWNHHGVKFCYKVFDEIVLYDVAHERCIANYANLAMPKNFLQDDAIKRGLKLFEGFTPAYIGLTLNNKNEYKFLDGTLVGDWTGAKFVLGTGCWAGWHRGEPTNFNNTEHCVFSTVNGWYDVTCTPTFWKVNYVCQRNP